MLSLYLPRIEPYTVLEVICKVKTSIKRKIALKTNNYNFYIYIYIRKQ